MKEKQCLYRELEEKVRNAVFGESCEDGALGSFHGGSEWDNHLSPYSSAFWLADASSLTLPVQQIARVSTV